MADELTLNSGVTFQGSKLAKLPELTEAIASAIAYIQQNGTDYRMQVGNLLATFSGYASIYTSVATVQVFAGGTLPSTNWTTLNFASNGVNGPAYGITPDKANNKLILTKTGTYILSYTVPFAYDQVSGITTNFLSQLNIGGVPVNTYGDASCQVLPAENLRTTARSELVQVRLGDVSAVSPDAAPIIFGGMPTVFIRDVHILVRGVTGASDGSNYITFSVVNKSPSPDETLGSRATYDSGADDPEPWVPWKLGLASNQLLGADETLVLQIDETGSVATTYDDVLVGVRYSTSGLDDGLVVPYGLLQFEIPYICSAPPKDVTLKIMSLTNATTWVHDIGTRLSAIRLS